MPNYVDICKKFVLEANDPQIDYPALLEKLYTSKEFEREVKLKELFCREAEQNDYLLTRLNLLLQGAGLGLLGDIFLKFSRNHPDLFSPAAAEASLEPPSKRAKVEEDDAKERPSKRQKTALTDRQAYQIAKHASEGGKAWNSLDLESRKRLACFAAVLGNQAVIEALLKLGMGVNDSILPESEQASLLYFAAANGHEGLVKFLIGRGANWNVITGNKATPLWVASAYADDNGQLADKYIKIIGCLIKNGTNIIERANQAGGTPFWVACQNGHAEVAKLLLARGAGANQADNDGVTPLHVACYNRHKAVVDLLLRGGADVKQANKDGFAPLHSVCRNGHAEIAELLLASGANVNQANNYGVTPLHVACYNRHKAVVDLLLRGGADVNQANKDKVTPLYVACQNGHAEIAELLLASGANVNQANKNKVTPLYVACQNGHKQVVELLLAKRANANQANKNRFTPLYVACQNGHKDIVEILVERGADVSIPSAATLEMVARQRGHNDIAEYLRLVAQINVIFSGDSTEQQKTDAAVKVKAAFPNNTSEQIDLVKSLLHYLESRFPGEAGYSVVENVLKEHNLMDTQMFEEFKRLTEWKKRGLRGLCVEKAAAECVRGNETKGVFA